MAEPVSLDRVRLARAAAAARDVAVRAMEAVSEHVTVLGRTYAIRPAGVLGPRERRELLEVWRRCEAHEQRARVTPVEQREYLEGLRRIAQLAVVGVSSALLRTLTRGALLEIRRAYERASFAEAEPVIAAAPGVRDRYAGELERIKKKIVYPTTTEVP